MSAQQKKAVAIVEVGEIGKSIAEELLRHGYPLKVVSRQGSKNASLPALEKAGATIVQIDYQSDASIAAALKGIEVVISTLSGAAFAYQFNLAKIAKQTGVKLFVPSMWGFDYVNPRFQDPKQNPPMIEEKFSLLARLGEIGLPWFAISNGLFSSWTFSSAHGIRAKECTVHWYGRTDKVLTFTHLDDVAAFLRTVLENVPIPAQGKGRWFYAESCRASFDDVFAEAQRLDGPDKPWSITHLPVDGAVKKQTEDSAAGEVAWHFALIDEGHGLREKNDNDEIGFSPAYGFKDAVHEALQSGRR